MLLVFKNHSNLSYNFNGMCVWHRQTMGSDLNLSCWKITDISDPC